VIFYPKYAIFVSYRIQKGGMIVVELRTTPIFDKWLSGLRDNVARLRIAARLKRVELGNFGDAKSVGQSISELRLDYGPGYRLYFTKQNNMVVILLCGGDKSTQAADIAKAHLLAATLPLDTADTDIANNLAIKPKEEP
jgi:putative addiction module killer protein